MTMEVTKTWMPSEYYGDTVPTARPSPADWLKRLDNGAYVLEAPFPGEDFGPKDRLLQNGEKVLFNWTAKIIAVDFDRAYDRPIFWPLVDGCETFAWEPEDADTVVDDPEVLKKQIENELVYHKDVTIEFYCWSEDISFTFHDGAFTAIDGVTP